MTTCECGCGGTPKGANSKFCIGHDATHRKNLNAAIVAGWEARAELARRCWSLTDDAVAHLAVDPVSVGTQQMMEANSV